MFLTNKLRSGYSTGAEIKTAYENEPDTNAFTDSEKSKVAEAMTESNYALSVGKIMNPLLHLPLKNGFNMPFGTGSVTFTRSTTATYIDRYGIVQSAAINTPRFEKEGLLIEGASTNKLTYSEEFDNWSKTQCTVSSNTTTAPDGTTTADGIIANTSTGAKYVYQNQSTASTQLSGSCFMKAGDKQWGSLSIYLFDASDNILKNGRCWFNLDTGEVGTENSCTGFITELTDGWYRCSIVIDKYTEGTVVDNGQLEIFTSNGDNDYSFVGDDTTINTYIWGAQLEEFSHSTSYISTTSVAATRAAEDCYVDYEGNIPETLSDITFLLDYTSAKISTDYNQTCLYIGCSNNYIKLTKFSNNTYINFYYGYPSTVSITLDSTKNCLGLTYNKDNNKITVYLNGALQFRNTYSATIGDINSVINIGKSISSSAVGTLHISNFRIYDVALTEQEMRIA